MVDSTMIFQTLKFSKRKFQTDCNEINFKKEMEMYYNSELVIMAQYPCCYKEKKRKTELKSTQRLKASKLNHTTSAHILTLHLSTRSGYRKQS